MSFSSLLRQKCTILRPTYGPAVDAFGQPILSWDIHKDHVPCRLMPIRGREIETISKDIVISNHKLFVRHFGAVADDPREYDLICDITEADGTNRDENAGCFDIIMVSHIGEYGKEHHLELYLVRRKGPP